MMKRFFRCLALVLALALVGSASAEQLSAYLSEGVFFTLNKAVRRDNKLFLQGTIRAIDARDVLVPISLSSDLSKGRQAPERLMPAQRRLHAGRPNEAALLHQL